MKNVNLVCPIGYTGYGITSLNILKELSLLCNVTLFPIGGAQKLFLNSNAEINLIKSCVAGQSFYDSDASVLKIWHAHDLTMRPGKGKYCVFPFFELDTLSISEVHQLNQADVIFSASNWGKHILENNGIKKPVIVAPLGVDTSIFSPTDTKSHEPYIFFNIGKWEQRKSQDIIIECFNKAFNNIDNVELWLVPHNPFLSEQEQNEWVKIAESSELSHKIRIFPRLSTQYDLANLINNADCGLFLSRAEGWNNELIESMAMNKPVIVTNYSAHTEYCNTNNSFLVNINSLELANDNKWFHGEGSWAHIGDTEKDDIIYNMRMVYKNDIRSNIAGLQTAQKLTWNSTAEIIYANT